MGRFEPVAAGRAVVTAADMVGGHVSLDVSCLDRLYLNGFVAKLQTPGGVVYFFRDHRGKPIVSPALFEPIGEKFRRDIKDWARANGIPLIRFAAGDRKADVMAPYLDAAAATGRSQVVAVGCAQEFQRVWTARQRDTDPGMCPQFSFTKEHRRVSVSIRKSCERGMPMAGAAFAVGHACGGVTDPGLRVPAGAVTRCGGLRGWRSRAGTVPVPSR